MSDAVAAAEPRRLTAGQRRKRFVSRRLAQFKRVRKAQSESHRNNIPLNLPMRLFKLAFERNKMWSFSPKDPVERATGIALITLRSMLFSQMQDFCRAIAHNVALSGKSTVEEPLVCAAAAQLSLLSNQRLEVTTEQAIGAVRSIRGAKAKANAAVHAAATAAASSGK